jgi:hypothetical protein
MGRGQLRALLAMSIIAVTLAVGASSALYETSASAATPSLSGTWSCCGAGGASPQLWVINGSSGYLEELNGTKFGTLTLTQSGNSVVLSQIYYASFAAGYTAQFTGTVSPDGRTMTGSWTSNANQAGTLTAVLTGPAPPGVLATGDVEPLAATIATPGQVFHDMKHNIENAAIAVALMLGLTFPSTIFNQTFSANYDEIISMIDERRQRWRRLFRRNAAANPSRTSLANVDEIDATSIPWFYGVLVIGAILGAMLSPHFGLNTATVVAFASTIVAFALGTLISWFVTRLFRQRRGYRTLAYRKALPMGLAIAALCVIISRISSFEPGYLYGVVVGVAFAETMNDRHNAHLTAISSLTTMGVALLAWFVWIPVNHFALEHSGIVPLAVIDNVLGSIFIGGLVGTVIGLLPLALLPGRTLSNWRKDAWAALFFVALFLLIEVELRPAAGPAKPAHAPVVTAIVLFVLFGAATFTMRRYFARRQDQRLALPAPAPEPS